jgi:hypothetical protein
MVQQLKVLLTRNDNHINGCTAGQSEHTSLEAKSEPVLHAVPLLETYSTP